MTRPLSGVRALGRRFRLALDRRPAGGPSGAHLGRGVGSSLEFQDRRPYVAGDDVRHLDWAAYARTDQPMVRLYREEVAPRVELLLDGSASMGVHPDKAALAVDLTALLVEAARATGCVVRLIHLGERAEPLELERFLEQGVPLDGARPVHDGLPTARGLLRPGSVRVVLSDFLTPADPGTWLRPVATGSGGLWLVQLLGAQDADPPQEGALRLVDAEDGSAQDLVLDARVRSTYLERLRRLQAGLEEEARRASGRHLRLVGGGVADDASRERALDRACRTTLLAEGLLEPA